MHPVRSEAVGDAATPAFLVERRQAIVERVHKAGRADVAELAVAFDVTTETIRRDLIALERDRLVRRVHGGAMPWRNGRFEPVLDIRMRQNAEAKSRIANAALQELPERGSIIIDSGSTAAYFADVLDRDRDLTVITNSIPIVTSLATTALPRVTLIGGGLRRDTMALVDEAGVEMLDGITVDALFLACDGVSLDRGFTTPYRHEAALKKAMLASARRAVMLFDHSKIGNDQLLRFAHIGDVDVIITDAEVADSTVAMLEDQGPVVIRA